MSDAVITKPKGGDLARLAGIWCNDPAFRAWLQAPTVEAARERICYVCGVESRAELDHSASAKAIFNESFRKAYRDHLQTRRPT